MPRVLIVDDEAGLRAAVARTLKAEGYETAEARDGVEAVSLLQRGGIDAVLLDLQMPRLDGFGVLDALRTERGAPPVIVLTAHASLDNAVRAVREGAEDFVQKPPSAEAILHRLRRALEHARQQAELEDQPASPEMLGDGPAMQELRERVSRIATSDSRVLILGESGTGKELVARAIHAGSRRASGPLVRLNCAAVPADLFEAELFGHVKGAFTGAVVSRRGRFERASGGTLLLDEIGEIPLASQPKLLRALEDGEIERVGAESGTRVDVRVVASTNRDLGAMVSDGRFRQDLYFRLDVVRIEVPPLRRRLEDVPLLARHFLDRACREAGRGRTQLDEEALVLLAAQRWPGNVRQLQNLMERVAILEPAGSVDARAIARHLHGAPGGREADKHTQTATLSEAVASFERRFIALALERNRGNVSATAREIGFERSALYKKMKALGLERG
jgi:DNA-binding NtrC family response regulator